MTFCFRSFASRLTGPMATAVALALCAALAACGASNDGNLGSVSDAGALKTSSYAALETPTLSPAYRLAQILPGAPSEGDRDGSSTSASMSPRTVVLP